MFDERHRDGPVGRSGKPDWPGLSAGAMASPGTPALNSGGAAELALAALSEGVVLHLASGEIAACNPAAERILGLTQDQMMGRTSIDPRWRAVHEDGSAFLGASHPAMVTLRTGEPLRGVIMGIHWPDGSLRWISVNSQPVPGPGGLLSAVVATFADVTERKALEEARRRDEESRRLLAETVQRERQQFRAIAENVIDGMILIDPDGSIGWANGAAARLFGFRGPPGAPPTEEWFAATFAPRDLAGRPLPAEEWPGARALRGETVARFPFVLDPIGSTSPRVLSVNAVPLPADGDGRRQAIVTFRDVTELRRAEEELKEHRDHLEELVVQRSAELVAANQELKAAEERLRLAQEAGNVGTFEWDARVDRVTFSPELERLHGLPAGTFAGDYRTALASVHPEDVPGLFALAKKAFHEGGDIQTEFRIVRADGEVRWLDLWGKIFRDAAGRPVRMTGVNKDITERKRAEEALRGRERELEAFSYTVSHDLRAPLRAVHGFSTLLERHLDDRLDAEGRRLLGVVERAASQMGELVDGLLGDTRIGRISLSRETVEMRRLAEQVLAEQSRAAGPGLLEVRIGELPAAYADRGLAREVLRQLLSNAIKFSAGRPRPLVEVGFEETPEGAAYFVRDNGVGFDATYGERIFGVFERLHGPESFDGTGIGLAVVRRIVERHGGWIRAEGELDRGVTVRFTLGPGR